MDRLINICYSVDKEFLNLTVESMRYVKKFFKSTDHDLQFYIICDGCDSIDDVINVWDDSLDDMPLPHRRAYIPEILDVDRIIYLDSDTICQTCISSLWNIDIGDNALGASPHRYIKTMNDACFLYGLNIPDHIRESNLPYLNSGVMLIDCEMWKRLNYTSMCSDAFRMYHSNEQRNNDEIGINMAFSKKYFLLDEKWNYAPDGEWIKPYILHYYGQHINDKPPNQYF